MFIFLHDVCLYSYMMYVYTYWHDVCLYSYKMYVYLLTWCMFIFLHDVCLYSHMMYIYILTWCMFIFSHDVCLYSLIMMYVYILTSLLNPIFWYLICLFPDNKQIVILFTEPVPEFQKSFTSTIADLVCSFQLPFVWVDSAFFFTWSKLSQFHLRLIRFRSSSTRKNKPATTRLFKKRGFLPLRKSAIPEVHRLSGLTCCRVLMEGHAGLE